MGRLRRFYRRRRGRKKFKKRTLKPSQLFKLYFFYPVCLQERLEGYPDVPTMGELGYYDQWLGSSRCIVAPAGTPENVIKFYEDAFQKLMEDADYLKAAEAAGMETDYKNSADTAALIKQQQDFTESLADVWGD